MKKKIEVKGEKKNSTDFLFLMLILMIKMNYKTKN